MPEEGLDSTRIVGAEIVGSPVFYPAFGDLWMPTWGDDDRLYLSWGDGTGFRDGYPTGYPDYLSDDQVPVTSCPEDEYLPEDEGYFPCWLWCNVFGCGPGESRPTSALTDAGVLWFEGTPPDFTDVDVASIDLPSAEPFFLAGEGGLDVSGENDKPSSLLFLDGRLYLAGHRPAAFPTLGYLAYSDDRGRTWTEVPGSPWQDTSNFRVLMFINMGRGYGLNEDGYVYALGVGTEASWMEGTVYLARVPRGSVAVYGAFEYLSGLDGGEPLWSASQPQAIPLDGLRSTGQASVMYHGESGRYLMLSTDAGLSDQPPGTGALFEAPRPWGPWTRAAVLCFSHSCHDEATADPAWTDGKYIAGLIPKGTGSGHVFFTISGGDRHYQLQIGRIELVVEAIGSG